MKTKRSMTVALLTALGCPSVRRDCIPVLNDPQSEALRRRPDQECR